MTKPDIKLSDNLPAIPDEGHRLDDRHKIIALNTKLAVTRDLEDIFRVLDKALGDDVTVEHVYRRAMLPGVEKDQYGKNIRYDHNIFSHQNLEAMRDGEVTARDLPVEQAYLLKSALLNVAMNKIFVSDDDKVRSLKVDTFNLLSDAVNNAVIDVARVSPGEQKELALQHVTIAESLGMKELVVDSLFKKDSEVKTLRSAITKGLEGLRIDGETLDKGIERVGKFKSALDKLEKEQIVRRNEIFKRARTLENDLKVTSDSVIAKVQKDVFADLREKYNKIKENASNAAYKIAEQIFEKFYDMEQFFSTIPQNEIEFKYRDGVDSWREKTDIIKFIQGKKTAVLLTKSKEEPYTYCPPSILENKDVYIQKIQNILTTSDEKYLEGHYSKISAPTADKISEKDTLFINKGLLADLARLTDKNERATILLKKLKDISALYKSGYELLNKEKDAQFKEVKITRD